MITPKRLDELTSVLTREMSTTLRMFAVTMDAEEREDAWMVGAGAAAIFLVACHAMLPEPRKTLDATLAAINLGADDMLADAAKVKT